MTGQGAHAGACASSLTPSPTRGTTLHPAFQLTQPRRQGPSARSPLPGAPCLERPARRPCCAAALSRTQPARTWCLQCFPARSGMEHPCSSPPPARDPQGCDGPRKGVHRAPRVVAPLCVPGGAWRETLPMSWGGQCAPAHCPGFRARCSRCEIRSLPPGLSQPSHLAWPDPGPRGLP